MSPRTFLLVLLVLGTTDGCERPPPAAPVQTAPSLRPTALHDWTAEPAVAEPERTAAGPRVLSAAPNVTETCCALGLIEGLVGRTRYCNYPPDVLTVPSIGALNDLNVETLVSLRPELVILSGTSRALATRLDALGLRYEAVPDVTLADLFAATARIGEWCGRPETARRLVGAIQDDLARVEVRYRGRLRARVLLLLAPLPDPPTQVQVAGPGSFYDDLLRRAGHANVAAPARDPFPRLALEFILHADPDVIIELAADADMRPGGDDEARRVWSQVGPLKAVQAGRIHVLRGPQHFVLGPRIALTFDALCATIAGQRHE